MRPPGRSPVVSPVAPGGKQSAEGLAGPLRTPRTATDLEGSMLKEGEKAPAVTGVSYDGATFDLGAPGRRTVLFFYPKANTGG